MALPLFLLLSYLLGSLSTAVILSRLMGLPDPRQQGSGNPGASNLLRSGHRWLAVVVLVGDILKAVFPLLLAQNIGLDTFQIACLGVATCLGHAFPLFFQFRGGKSVATALGSLVIIAWPLGLLVLAIWLLVFARYRYASLASIVAAISTPILALYWAPSQSYWPINVMAALLISRHYANLKRLWQGKELSVYTSPQS